MRGAPDLAIVRRICADDPEALDLIDQATARGPGGNNNPEGTNKAGLVIGENYSIDPVPRVDPPKRDRNSQAMRRLRQDFPELHARVLEKNLGVHAAAVEAGIRPPRLSIYLANPVTAARALIKAASPEFIRELIQALNERDDAP